MDIVLIRHTSVGVEKGTCYGWSDVPVADTFETEAIAACAMGGVSFNGGKGAVVGIFFGALLMGIINNAMNLMYISSYWQQVVKGLIIIASVLYSIYNSKKN